MDMKNLRRKQLRLNVYDYSKTGAYFTTICTKDRRLHFKNTEIRRIVEETWLKIPEHFDNLELDNYVIMPNHIHGILKIVGVRFIEPEKKGVINHAPTELDNCRGEVPSPRGSGNLTPTLGQIVGYFKYLSTKQINKYRGTPGQKFWQRNYYEHVIRNERELMKIREYITNNPYQWNEDTENPENWKFGKRIDIDDYYRNIWE